MGGEEEFNHLTGIYSSFQKASAEHPGSDGRTIDGCIGTYGRINQRNCGFLQNIWQLAWEYDGQ